MHVKNEEKSKRKRKSIKGFAPVIITAWPNRQNF